MTKKTLTEQILRKRLIEDGFTHSQVAEEFGLKVGTVLSKASRAGIKVRDTRHAAFPNRKIVDDDETVLDLLEHRFEGRVARLAAHYGAQKSTTYAYLNRLRKRMSRTV